MSTKEPELETLEKGWKDIFSALGGNKASPQPYPYKAQGTSADYLDQKGKAVGTVAAEPQKLKPQGTQASVGVFDHIFTALGHAANQVQGAVSHLREATKGMKSAPHLIPKDHGLYPTQPATQPQNAKPVLPQSEPSFDPENPFGAASIHAQDFANTRAQREQESAMKETHLQDQAAKNVLSSNGGSTYKPTPASSHVMDMHSKLAADLALPESKRQPAITATPPSIVRPKKQ